MSGSLQVSATVLFVTDLERSVTFYTELLGCMVAVREAKAALLLAADGFEIYLVARGNRAGHPLGGIGNHGITWSTESEAELHDLADALRASKQYVDTHEEGGVTFLEGRDPDGLRVMVAFPGPKSHARSLVQSRLYA